MTEVRVDHLSLLQFATEVFAAAGMDDVDAACVADVLVWANERGIDSHGISRMPIYLNEIARGELNVQGTPSFRQLLPALLYSNVNARQAPLA